MMSTIERSWNNNPACKQVIHRILHAVLLHELLDFFWTFDVRRRVLTGIGAALPVLLTLWLPSARGSHEAGSAASTVGRVALHLNRQWFSAPAPQIPVYAREHAPGSRVASCSRRLRSSRRQSCSISSRSETWTRPSVSIPDQLVVEGGMVNGGRSSLRSAPHAENESYVTPR